MGHVFFQEANEIIDTLTKAGYEAFIVGGAVRDLLLNREIHDIDITTSAPVEKIKELFSRTIDVAIKHGTILVKHNGQLFEVTTYRSRSLELDLQLRDFTMNAICLTKENEFVDYFLGKEDIENKLIRGVECPSNRFREDPLRMLRAVRFVGQLGFTIEPKTLEAIKTNVKLINDVAIERIAVELEKIMTSQFLKASIIEFKKTNLINEIKLFQPLAHLFNDHLILNKLSRLKSMTEVWALLLWQADVENPGRFLEKWKQSRKRVKEVTSILHYLKRVVARGYYQDEDLYTLGLETSRKAEVVLAVLLGKEADLISLKKKYEQLPITKKDELALKGTDVITLLKNNEPKKRISEIISASEKAVITRKVINDKEEIIHWLKKEGLVDA